MKEIILLMAGTSVAVRLDETIASFATPLEAFFRGFLKSRGPASAELTVSYNHLVPFPEFGFVPVSLSRAPEQQPSGILHLVQKAYPFADSVLLVGFLNGVLAYNVRSRKGHLYLFRSEGRNLIQGSLHKLLFVFMALVVTEQKKLMIHGAGLRIESEGCLFLGVSGAGKSTVAGHVERDGVLSDDAPVVTRSGKRFVLHASPFSQVTLFDGRAADHYRKKVPLTKLLFLRQADHLELKHREKRTALAELLRTHIHGYDIMDRHLKTLAFQFCCDLCESVPAFDLHFENNNRFVSLLGPAGPCFCDPPG